MKYEFDIELTTLHVGSVHRVVTLGLQGSDSAESFLNDLESQDKRSFKKIMGRLRYVSDVGSYEHKVKFRSLGGGLFEAKVMKPKAVRLYVFYDRKTLGDESMILAAHGGEKNSQKRDIENARKRKKRYETLIKQRDTSLQLKEKDGEA